MRTLALLIGSLILLGAGARRAEACGGGGSNDGLGMLYVGVAVVGGAYVSSTIAFGVADVTDDDHSIAYGVLETTVNAGYATATGAIAVDAATNHGNWGIPAALTALHIGLAAHGIYAIVKRANKRPPPPDRAPPPVDYDGPPGNFQVGPVSAVVTPAAIRDGAGIGLAGTF